MTCNDIVGQVARRGGKGGTAQIHQACGLLTLHISSPGILVGAFRMADTIRQILPKRKHSPFNTRATPVMACFYSLMLTLSYDLCHPMSFFMHATWPQ